jgi:histidine triad (HIT) family protein
MENCIFCRIVRGESPCFKVYENEQILAFADINPIAEGHTLIIPKTHAENIWEIPGENLVAIHLASQRVARAMKAALKPSGIAALQLNGRGANQMVMHYHLHLVPRIGHAPELPITVWDLKPGELTAIEKTAQRIAAALE